MCSTNAQSYRAAWNSGVTIENFSLTLKPRGCARPMTRMRRWIHGNKLQGYQNPQRHKRIWEKSATVPKCTSPAHSLTSTEGPFISRHSLGSEGSFPHMCTILLYLGVPMFAAVAQPKWFTLRMGSAGESFIQLRPQKEFYTSHKKQPGYFIQQIIQMCCIWTKTKTALQEVTMAELIASPAGLTHRDKLTENSVCPWSLGFC